MELGGAPCRAVTGTSRRWGWRRGSCISEPPRAQVPPALPSLPRLCHTPGPWSRARLSGLEACFTRGKRHDLVVCWLWTKAYITTQGPRHFHHRGGLPCAAFRAAPAHREPIVDSAAVSPVPGLSCTDPVAARLASLVCSGPPAMFGYSSFWGGRCACAIIPQWHPGVTPCLPLRDAVRLSFKAAALRAAPASRVGGFWVAGVFTKPAGSYRRRPRGGVWRQPPPVATVPSQACVGARVPRVCARVLCRNVCVPVRWLRAPCPQLTRGPPPPHPSLSHLSPSLLLLRLKESRKGGLFIFDLLQRHLSSPLFGLTFSWLLEGLRSAA